MQSPSRQRREGSLGPRPRPYLWPTSLPTEPPPRAGSSGLSPCGSSGPEAPAGAPPGPALPSDGERGSLARAILRERTAAGGGGGAGRYQLRAPPSALPAPPPQWNGRGGLGGWGAGGRAPPTAGGNVQAQSPPHPRRPCVGKGHPMWEGGSQGPRVARGCLIREVVVIIIAAVTALGEGRNSGAVTAGGSWLLTSAGRSCWRGESHWCSAACPSQHLPVGPGDMGEAQDDLPRAVPTFQPPPLVPAQVGWSRPLARWEVAVCPPSCRHSEFSLPPFPAPKAIRQPIGAPICQCLCARLSSARGTGCQAADVAATALGALSAPSDLPREL